MALSLPPLVSRKDIRPNLLAINEYIFKHMWNKDRLIIYDFEIYIFINSPSKTIVFPDIPILSNENVYMCNFPKEFFK